MTSQPDRKVKVACPLDCYDVCGIIADISGGRITKLAGDPNHPLTRGRICDKGRRHLDRHYHPDRLTTPLMKEKGAWKPVSWETAISRLAEELASAKSVHGPLSVLHYTSGGHGGLTKTVDQIFFDCFGGATTSRGSLCRGAGVAAQTYDFGGLRMHAPHDLRHAETMILWGKNPVETSLHLAMILKQNKKTKIILIDPLKTPSANICDLHIRIKPATDGALALAMAHHIIRTDRFSPDFIRERVLGFLRFKQSIETCTPDWAAGICGIPVGKIISLAETYADHGPSAIFPGHGIQRYANGGNTIRAIDALAAVTGNIGVSGGGVSYGNISLSPLVNDISTVTRQYRRHHRSFPKSKLGDFLETSNDPPIRVAVVAKANPLVQNPDAGKVAGLFERIGFTVVIDHFMTDTAARADMVLPCTNLFEEADIMFGTMFSPWLNYSEQAVAPIPGVMSEFDLFRKLARRLDLTNYPDLDREDFLKKSIEPLLKRKKMTFAEIKKQPVFVPDGEVPWASGLFDTPSGRYELYSETAKKDGHPPLPAFIPPETGSKAYPFRLITPHHKKSLHSQHFFFDDGPPNAYVSPEAMDRLGLADGENVNVISSNGAIMVNLCRKDHMFNDTVMIYEGRSEKSGCVNRLTPSTLSDMGEQAAYYDCFCRIEPIRKESDKMNRFGDRNAKI